LYSNVAFRLDITSTTHHLLLYINSQCYCVGCHSADVTAVLICTSDLLLYASDSIVPYLDPCDAHKDIYSIHSSCSSLVACLAIVGAPLDLLHKTYRKGFSKRLVGLDDEFKGYNSQWLSWIRPSLLPRGKFRWPGLV